MDARTPGPFHDVKTPRGWLYRLRREDRLPLPWSELVTYAMVLVATIAPGTGLLWYAFTGGTPPGDPDDGAILAIVPSLLLLLPGLMIAICFVNSQLGRHEVRVDAASIRATWRLGPISWSKTIPRSSVAQLTVVRRSWSRPADPPPGNDYHVLVAEDQNGKRRTLVEPYPREILLALGAELSTRWKALGFDPDALDVGPKKVDVIEDTEVVTDIRDRPGPPRGTRLTLEHVGPQRVRITSPARGLLSVPFVVAVIIAATALVLAFAIGQPPAGASGPYVALLVSLAALSIVIGAKRSCVETILSATPDSLTIVRTGLTSTSCKTWSRHEIASIRVDVKVIPSSAAAEGSLIVSRLLIRTKNAPCLSLFATAEEQALVELLRKPSRAPASAFVVVGSRQGPGAIVDVVPIAVGRYDYAVRQQMPSCKPELPSSSLTIDAEPEEELEFGTWLSKPEAEWVATTLRGALGVPASTV